MFRNKKFPGFVHPYNLLKYFQNKEIDSNRNTSIQMDLSKKFLNRGSNKFYCSSPVSFSSFTWKLREAGLLLLCHLSLSCFVNKVMTPWYYAVTKSFVIDDVRLRDRLWFVCFLCKTLPKRLKFNEIDIYMLKVKNKSTRTRSEICSKLTIKTPKQR